jgi:4-amino-4-deoxy-L-arabinose transferase-like glycosyltransferase
MRVVWQRGWVAALLVILVVTGLIWHRTEPQPLATFDQPFYLGIAHDLLVSGRFTDGFAFAAHGPASVRPSGMRMGPLYPALLAGVAMVDPGLNRGMACVVATSGEDPSCPKAAPVMRWLQFAELAGFFLLVWWLGGQAGGAGLGWLALALALITTPLLVRSVDYLMTEMTCLLLSTGAIACWVASGRACKPRWAWLWAAGCGLLLGLTALTRPGFVYLIYAWLAAVAAAALLLRCRGAWPRLLALAAGAAVAVLPWMIRNWALFGRFAVSFGYASHTLVQRIAFDTMTWREYGRSYICWLPDGTALGRRFFGPQACDRFGWDEQPNSFYVLGLRHMLDETLQAAGGYEHHLSYLLHTYILPHPFWHLAVSVPLALRGAYVSHWWGFVLLPVCLWLTVARLRRRDFMFPTVALPALFMLGFNAAVAVNQVRYNLLLIPAYAIAGAMSLAWVAGRAATGRIKAWA